MNWLSLRKKCTRREDVCTVAGLNKLTIEVPWVELMEIESGNDVGLAGEMGGLAVEEVDDELLVGGEESEAWGEVGTVISHDSVQVIKWYRASLQGDGE